MVFKAVINGTVEKPRSKKPMTGISAIGSVNRIAFGVGISGATLSDEVAIKMTGEFKKD